MTISHVYGIPISRLSSQIARGLGRAPSTLSREWCRPGSPPGGYRAWLAAARQAITATHDFLDLARGA